MNGIAFKICVGTGLICLASIPLIYLAEQKLWPEWPYHITQVALVPICWVASVVYMVSRSKGSEEGRSGVRPLLVGFAFLAASAYLVLLAYVFVGMQSSGF